jgi:ribosomal protein L11 methyltransferase
VTARAVRFEVAVQAPDVDEALSSALCEIPCSWSAPPRGPVEVRVSEEDAGGAREALSAAGLAILSETLEEPRDWVAESAALRRPVAVGRYLLDPHEGASATPAGGRIRIELPAARAFGTGSHESTRLAMRLLLAEDLRGRRVLDAGCGTGTLAFVAACEGAAWSVAFDIDPDAAFATRAQALANGLDAAGSRDGRGVTAFAGPASALRGEGRFDVVVANMLQEEVTPLLPDLGRLLVPGGRLVTAGQLLSRQAEWLSVLGENGFEADSLAAEGEWLGVAAARTPRS